MSVVASKMLSAEEKEQLLKEILGKDYATAGNHLPILSGLIDKIGFVDNFFTLAELIPILNKILSVRIFAVTASGASILSIFLFPAGAMISLINANETGKRMYSFRAIAYALTSWAFDKPVLTGSMRVMANARSGFPVIQQNEITERENLWKKSSNDAISKMKATAHEKNIPVLGLKVFLRMISDNKQQKCCEILLKGFEKEFEGATLRVWKSNYSIKYPQ